MAATTTTTSLVNVGDEKDVVFWVNKADTRKVAKEIDWECPCLDSMKNSPCGAQFKDAFSCYVNSDTEVKGSDCFQFMHTFRKCVMRHKDYYEALDEHNNDDDDEPHP
jgi:hypothetical protein